MKEGRVKAVIQYLRWAAVWMLAVLGVFSIAGAFLGADRTRILFNSGPVVVLLILLAAVLVASVASSTKLRRSPGLLLLHVAPVIILIGGFLGTPFGRSLAARVGFPDAPARGLLILEEGDEGDLLFDPSTKEPIGKLPFAVRLDRFVVERYTQTRDQAVRRYASEIVFLDETAELPAVVEVNKTARHKGHLFYQYAGSDGSRPYSVLLVTFDRGVPAVYAGLVLLCVGTFLWGWGEPALRAWKARGHVD